MTSPAGVLTQFVVLLAFWLFLSDQYNVVFIGMGVVCAALVTALTNRTVATAGGGVDGALRRLPIALVRFAWFSVWLLARIVVASIQVAGFVCSPRLQIEPRFIRFRAPFRSAGARVLLANSITLVPGTMTVRLDGDEYLVHALARSAADDLRDGTLQNKVAAVFGEQQGQGPPDSAEWEPWEVLP